MVVLSSKLVIPRERSNSVSRNNDAIKQKK